MTVEENTALKILSIGWYVMGVMVCLMSLLPLIHVIFGISLQSLAPHIQNSAMNTVFKIIGSIIASVGILIVFIGEITGIALIFAGRFIASRKHYFFVS